jgi:ankyrin repeat protein
MHYAAHKGDMKLIRLLKHRGANLDVKNKAGYTPIDVASYNYDAKVVRYFTDEGATKTHFFNSAYN